MKSILLSIAGFRIRLVLHETEYIYSKKLFISTLMKSFKGFILPTDHGDVANFTIDIVQNNEAKILTQKEGSFIEFYQLSPLKSTIMTFYTIGIQQLSLILRYVLQELLMDNDGFFMHGACSIYKKDAILYLGDSGKGKSTILKLTRNLAQPFSDDIFIVRKVGNSYKSYQSPIFDKQHWIHKGWNGFEIRSIYFLEHANNFTIEELSSGDILEAGLRQVVYNNATKSRYLRSYFSFIQKHARLARRLSFRKNEKQIKELFT